MSLDQFRNPSNKGRSPSFNYPGGGLNNPMEYMVSGLPFVTRSTVDGNSVQQINFPFVTNFFTIKNTTSGTLSVGFTENGVNGSNRFTLAENESFSADIRAKSIFVKSENSNSNTFELIAGMTQIPKKNFPVLTGSAAGFDSTATGSFEYGFNGIG